MDNLLYQARKSSAKQIFTLCLILTALLSQHSWRTSHLSIPGGRGKMACRWHTHMREWHTHTIQMQTPTHREKHNQSLNHRLWWWLRGNEVEKGSTHEKWSWACYFDVEVTYSHCGKDILSLSNNGEVVYFTKDGNDVTYCKYRSAYLITRTTVKLVYWWEFHQEKASKLSIIISSCAMLGWASREILGQQ